MPDCELQQVCPFFKDQLDLRDEMSEAVKLRYCRGCNELCARHIVYRELGPDYIPDNLNPLQMGRLHEILDASVPADSQQLDLGMLFVPVRYIASA